MLTAVFLQELWTLLNFLLPDIFQLKDLEAAGSRSDDPDTQASLIGRLKTILAPFVLRRVKADVMQQLVAKEQKVGLCIPGSVLWRCGHHL
jgi:SNF2 family DNA or RNA helicase